MANSARIVLLAATLVLLLSAGDVDAEDRWTEEQVLTFYMPGPGHIIVGPGTGSIDQADSAFGSVSVFDLPLLEDLDNNSKSLGRFRGAFLTDNHEGTNDLNLFTITFTSPAPVGYVVIAGDFNTLPKSVLPIIGGTEEFSGAEGYLELRVVLPEERPATRGEILNNPAHCELHYKLRRS